MFKRNLKQEIENIDWSQFNGPILYDSSKIAPTLIELLQLQDSQYAEIVGDKILNTLANNHSGCYYPAVLKALDLMIEICENTQNESCKICTLAILNDLYYFEPDVGGFNLCTHEELRAFVKTKLNPYADQEDRCG